jgi:hypothetical protein
VRHFRRELWFPRMLDRRFHDAWRDAGATSLEDRCGAQKREILATHEPGGRRRGGNPSVGGPFSALGRLRAEKLEIRRDSLPIPGVEMSIHTTGGLRSRGLRGRGDRRKVIVGAGRSGIVLVLVLVLGWSPPGSRLLVPGSRPFGETNPNADYSDFGGRGLRSQPDAEWTK